MNKRYLFLGLFGVVGIMVLISIVTVLTAKSPQKPVENSVVTETTETFPIQDSALPTKVIVQQPLPTLQFLPPEEVARIFYVWYATHPDPLRSGAYRERTEIASEYKDIMAAYVKRGLKPNRDPVFNCGDPKPPPNIIPKLAVYDQAQGQALVDLQEVPSGRELFRIKMVKVNNAWFVKDVWCAPRP